MRSLTLSLVAAAGLMIIAQPRAASAQVVTDRGEYPAPGYTTGNAWSGYAPSSTWQGYRPGTSWTGYRAPSVSAGQLARTVTPGASAPRPVQTLPPTGGNSVAARPTGLFAVAPAFYQEFGSGRNLFLHKPWLPNK